MEEVTPKEEQGHRKVDLRMDEDGRLVIPMGIECIREDKVPLEAMIKIPNRVLDVPPVRDSSVLYKQACSNDDITVLSWLPQWKKKSSDNAKKFNFNEMSAADLIGKESMKPVIIAGSGPSLKKNARYLKHKSDIRVVSCLHNFGYFEDMDLMGPDDYYLTLDSGEITIPEMIEGGKKYTEEEYWERTKNRTLIAVIYTPTVLLEKWRGPIKFFFAPTPNEELKNHVYSLLDPTKVPCFQVGGNALGACFYAARAILGCGPIIFIGADFCFSYDHKFHAWENTYQFAGVVPAVDIWGNRVWTWQSYYNFKTWFEYQAMGGAGNNTHMFINATEGGILGAYPEGNMKQIVQMGLREALATFNMPKIMGDLMAKQKDKEMLLF